MNRLLNFLRMLPLLWSWTEDVGRPRILIIGHGANLTVHTDHGVVLGGTNMTINTTDQTTNQ